MWHGHRTERRRVETESPGIWRIPSILDHLRRAERTSSDCCRADSVAVRGRIRDRTRDRTRSRRRGRADEPLCRRDTRDWSGRRERDWNKMEIMVSNCMRNWSIPHYLNSQNKESQMFSVVKMVLEMVKNAYLSSLAFLYSQICWFANVICTALWGSATTRLSNRLTSSRFQWGITVTPLRGPK